MNNSWWTAKEAYFKLWLSFASVTMCLRTKAESSCLSPIFLKLAILFYMCQPICKTELWSHRMIRVPLEIQYLKGNYLWTTNRDELLSPIVTVQTKRRSNLLCWIANLRRLFIMVHFNRFLTIIDKHKLWRGAPFL